MGMGLFWSRARGSSPLARGLRQPSWRPCCGCRIIPARAGFTPPSRWPPSGTADHPRSRGVYCPSVCSASIMPGSSPLARGLPSRIPSFGYPKRIIPARAGFTHSPASALDWSQDHPRSRGVYRPGPRPCCSPRGSSPLARGLPVDGHVHAGAGGIIPARAGFTCWPCIWTTGAADHPRSRGVYSTPPLKTFLIDGSSPLARGLPVGNAAQSSEEGIIPARAGFTPSRPAGPPPPGDHPRSRGVYRRQRLHRGIPAGSSPLARGLPAWGNLAYLSIRIIPARAGFTASSPSACTHRRDHPRSRGVYTARPGVARARSGSSPLARGLRFSSLSSRCRIGIIPARAGFTRRTRRRRPDRRDHPRSRGVYTTCSPGRVCAGWIIPARAGFTLADRWYPNEPVVYQTPAAFTADPGPAPPGRRSVAVVRGGASPLPDVLDATRPPRVFPAPVREPLRHAQTSGSVIRLEADRVDRADPHRHERGDDPRQGSDPGCRHQSDERGGHGEGRVVRHRDI